MTPAGKTVWFVASALALSASIVYFWKKKRRSFVQVGKISKLFFYPLKSLKAIEVDSGYCTKLGFEVNGVLDRSFMVIDSNSVLVSQRQAPKLVLFTQNISEKFLHVKAPNGEELKVELRNFVSPNDKIITCQVFTDNVNAVDCGDEAASFFERNINMPNVRLVHFIHTLSERKYTRDTKMNPFYKKLKQEHPVTFQDLCAIHSLSQASIDDLNSKMEGQQISVFNFRPNILINGCKAFAEDSWRLMKFESGAELSVLLTTDRCLLTTNDPDTGNLTKKEPLVTLRKFRSHKEDRYTNIVGSVPCIGVYNAVLSPGKIKVGDDIYADIGPQPKMINKLES